MMCTEDIQKHRTNDSIYSRIEMLLDLFQQMIKTGISYQLDRPTISYFRERVHSIITDHHENIPSRKAGELTRFMAEMQVSFLSQYRLPCLVSVSTTVEISLEIVRNLARIYLSMSCIFNMFQWENQTAFCIRICPWSCHRFHTWNTHVESNEN